MSSSTTERPAATTRATSTRIVEVVIAVGAAMSTTRDHAQMLARMIEAACEAIDATTGGFMRYEAQADVLVLQAPAFGVHNEQVVSGYRVSLGDGGNAARVFLSREPYISNDARQDPRLIQRFVRLFDTRNTVTIPLVLRDRPIGIFHAINKRSGDFDETDAQVLEMVAPLLAAGLQQALMFRAFEHERTRLERSMAVHEKLLETAIGGRGVAALCETLHGLVHRPVMVLDALRRPLASVQWNFDLAGIARELGEASAAEGVLGRLETAAGAGATARFAVVSVPVGGERGGYLLVAEQDGELDAIDTKAIEQTATLLAVEILKQRTLSAAERQAASALLVELFSDGVSAVGATQLLGRLGCLTRGPWRVVVFDFGGDAAGASATPFHRFAEVLRASLERALGSLKNHTRLMVWRDGFVAVTDPATGARLAERSQVRRLQNALDTLSGLTGAMRLRIGSGRVEHSAALLGNSLRTAGQAVRALDRLPVRGNALMFEDLGVYRLFLGTEQDGVYGEFVDQVLGPIFEADRRAGRETLADTLRTLAEHNFNLAETARELDIHLNTVKYRMNQIRDLLGRDPTRGEPRLEIELAFRIRELKRTPAAARAGR